MHIHYTVTQRTYHNDLTLPTIQLDRASGRHSQVPTRRRDTQLERITSLRVRGCMASNVECSLSVGVAQLGRGDEGIGGVRGRSGDAVNFG